MQQDLFHPNYARKHKLHENDGSIPWLHLAWYVTNLLVNISLSHKPNYEIAKTVQNLMNLNLGEYDQNNHPVSWLIPVTYQ